MADTNPSLVKNSLSAYLPYVFDFFLRLIVIRYILITGGSEILGIWGVFKAVLIFPEFVYQGIGTAIFLRTSRRIGGLVESLAVSVLFATIVGLVIAVLATSLVDFFKIPTSYRQMSILAFRLIAVTFIISSISSVFIRTLHGMGRFDLASLVVISISLLNSILSILFLKYGYSILALITLDLILSVLVTLLAAYTLWRIRRPGPAGFNHALTKSKILGLAKEATDQIRIAMQAKVMWEIDALVIPRFFGLTLMASYVPAQRLALFWKGLMWSGIWPAVPVTANDPAKASQTLFKIYWLQMLLTLPVAFLLFSLSGEIISVWLGPATRHDSAAFLRILVIATAIDFASAAFVSYWFAKGEFRPVLRSQAIAIGSKFIIVLAGIFRSDLLIFLAGSIAGSVTFTGLIFWKSLKEFSIPTRSWVKPLVPGAVGSMVAILVCSLLPASRTMLELAGKAIGFIVIAYGVSILIVRFLFKQTYRELRQFLSVQ